VHRDIYLRDKEPPRCTAMHSPENMKESMYAQRKIQARSRNHCRRGKAITITYSECVFVASVIQNAKCVRRTILPSVACPTLQYLYTSSHKRHDFLLTH